MEQSSERDDHINDFEVAGGPGRYFVAFQEGIVDRGLNFTKDFAVF